MSKHARRLAVGLSLLCLVAAACKSGNGPSAASLQAPTPAPAVSGHLHTQGTKLIGPNSKAIRLIGVNLQGMQTSNDEGSNQPDECGRAWRLPPDDAPKNIREWGFNHVRLTIAWANVEPQPPTQNSDGSLTHHWGEDYLKALDGLIESLQKEKLAIILDPAQFQWSSAFKATGLSSEKIACEGYGMPAWLNPNAANETIDQARCDFVANRAEQGVPEKPWDGMSAMWTMLGKRYGDDTSIIGADTINEPYFVKPTCSGADFQGMFQTLGKAIRDVVPRWLLLFEYFPETNMAFGIDSPPSFDDQIYEVHVYGQGWSDAQRLMDFAWGQAGQWGMPLYVGEFSAFGATSPRGGMPNWQEDTQSMLDYMRQRGISWAIFGYGGGLSLIERSGQPKADVIQALQKGI